MGARILVLSLALLVGGGVAYAGDDIATARRLFQSGTKHFDLGEYEAGLADFKEAYRLKDDPVLLYNIAQCHRMLKHNEEAIRAYKTYLARSGDQSHRADVEQKIAALQEAIDKQDRASTIPPTGVLTGKPEATAPAPSAAATPAPVAVATSAPAEPRPLYKKWWLWTAVGGVVVAGVAIGLGVGLSRGNGNFFPNVSY